MKKMLVICMMLALTIAALADRDNYTYSVVECGVYEIGGSKNELEGQIEFIYYTDSGDVALAVTGGVILALPLYNVFIVLIALLFLGFLFIEIDAWVVMFGATGTLIYVLTTTGSSWETFFMISIMIILAIKHANDLHSLPTFRVKVLSLIPTRRNKN